jgi:hypothetical protein
VKNFNFLYFFANKHQQLFYHLQGGKSTYEYNVEEFTDPYPEEVITEAKGKRERGEMPKGDFFNPEVDAASAPATCDK